MDDRALVAALARGDAAALDHVYRRYADRLFAYCLSILHDRDAAADVLHDTFLIAVRCAGQLRDPARLRAWLYAIARRECLRVRRAAARSVPLDEAGDVAAETVDPVAAVHAEQVRALVRAAAEGLSEADREVVELSLRHGFDAAEVAATLGVSRNHAHARLSRARDRLFRSLGTLLLARAGGCAELGRITVGWNGRLDPLLRKRVSRHLDGCARCAACVRDRLRPAALLGTYTLLPVVAVPSWVWAELAGAAGRLDAGPAPALAADGFPAVRSRAGRWPVAAAAVLVAVLIGVAALAPRLTPAATGGAWSLPGEAPAAAGPSGGTPTAAPVSASSGPASSGPVSSGPASAGPASRAPSTSGGPAVVAPFTVTAKASAVCGGSVGFRLTVTATASVPLQRALVYWRAPDLDRAQMARDGRTATFDVLWLRVPVTWWVEARAADGRSLTTAVTTTANPCEVGR